MSKFLILYALLGFMKLVTKENGHVKFRSNLNKILILIEKGNGNEKE
ncbi:hypothetical protein [Bacillus sp. BPN334]|nr:hypothetical protein [Bacillus sp. BPN334]